MSEGVQHHIEVRLLDADGESVAPFRTLPVQFAASGPGRPLSANIALFMLGLRLPDIGDYAFHQMWNGMEIGRIPLYVLRGTPEQFGRGEPGLPSR